jgi:hypothetical protein
LILEFRALKAVGMGLPGLIQLSQAALVRESEPSDVAVSDVEQALQCVDGFVGNLLVDVVSVQVLEKNGKAVLERVTVESRVPVQGQKKSVSFAEPLVLEKGESSDDSFDHSIPSRRQLRTKMPPKATIQSPTVAKGCKGTKKKIKDYVAQKKEDRFWLQPV